MMFEVTGLGRTEHGVGSVEIREGDAFFVHPVSFAASIEFDEALIEIGDGIEFEANDVDGMVTRLVGAMHRDDLYRTEG